MNPISPCCHHFCHLTEFPKYRAWHFMHNSTRATPINQTSPQQSAVLIRIPTRWQTGTAQAKMRPLIHLPPRESASKLAHFKRFAHYKTNCLRNSASTQQRTRSTCPARLTKTGGRKAVVDFSGLK